jgi:hypothetical protein
VYFVWHPYLAHHAGAEQQLWVVQAVEGKHDEHCILPQISLAAATGDPSQRSLTCSALLMGCSGTSPQPSAA